ncbi:MAG: hypothetical protein LC754_17135 [Acidobacteria bacterium]|nr:hypothetical protein [Acidobacteriota bacterium]
MKHRSGDNTRYIKLTRKAWAGVKFGVLIAVGVSAVVAFGIVFYQKFNSTGPYRMVYAGRILDKSVTIIESQTGSHPVRRLLIRTVDGEEIEVIINEALFNRAQPGMWIRSNNEGAEVSWTEQGQSSPAFKTSR